MKSLLIISFLLLVGCYGFGQHIELERDSEVKECYENASDSAKIFCLESVLLEIDSAMNNYYNLLITAFKNKGTNVDLKNFKKSQKLWKQMMETQCLSYYNIRLIDERKIAKLRCLIELTTNRHNELSKFMNRFRM